MKDNRDKSCVTCGTDKIVHKAFGQCANCYARVLRLEQKELV